MDFKHIIQLLWGWAWLIVLGAGMFGLATLAISRRMEPVYTASTTLIIKADGNRADSIYDTLLTTERLTKVYAEMPYKRPVLEAVIAHLQLDTNVNKLADKISVTILPDTLLIILEVEDVQPQRAAVIANEIVKVLSLQGDDVLGSRYTASRYGLHVIESARPALRPDSPRPLRNAFLATIVGGLFVAGIAFLIDYFDVSVRSREAVQALTGLATFAVVPRIGGVHPRDKLITVKQPFSPVAETYRLLRTHIEFVGREQPVQTLVITSAGTQEGKSTIAANLAVAFAQAGKRVVLVDTDLRRPTLHTFFQQPETPGVTTILTRQGVAPTVDYRVATTIPNLSLLPSGPLPHNPAELLSMPAMLDLIETLKRHADLVIFDSPALLAVADATLLASHCDATLLVVRAGSTSQSALVQAQQQLREFRVRLLGAVLNYAGNEHGSLSNYYARNGKKFFSGNQQQMANFSYPQYTNGSRPVNPTIGKDFTVENHTNSQH